MTDPSGDVLNEKIAHIDRLNGVIYEALRLHPPVPGIIQRKTPPEGIWIDDVHVPGNVFVFCPQYAIGRSTYLSQVCNVTTNNYQARLSTKNQKNSSPNAGTPGPNSSRRRALLRRS